MKCEVLIPPATLPIDYTSEVKPHLRLFDDSQQAYVLICMADAVDFFETETDCALTSRTYQATYYSTDPGFHHHHNSFWNAGYYGMTTPHHHRQKLNLPYGPVNVIDSVTADGVVLDPSTYDLRAAGNTDYLYLHGCSFTNLKTPIVIQYEAGFATELDEYGSESIGLPKDIRRALLYMVSNFFEQREPTSSKSNYVQNFGLERIFSKYRRTPMVG